MLLKAVEHILSKRQDVQFAIVGGGTALPEIQAMAEVMGLLDHVDFYGRVSDAEMLRVLNSCDVCVNPDRPTEMNNLSTMNKIMEYMALGKPIVQFDLKEGLGIRGPSVLVRAEHCSDGLWRQDHRVAR